MAGIDATIPLGIQQPNAMQSLSSLLGVANTAQAMQQRQLLMTGEQQSNDSGAIDLKQKNQNDQERTALQGFMQNPDNWQTNGQIDMAKINAAVPKLAPINSPSVIEGLSKLSDAQTTAKNSIFNLTQAKRTAVAGPLGVLGRAGVTDPQAYTNELDNIGKEFPDDYELQKLIAAKKQLIAVIPGQNMPKAAITASQALLNPEQQQANLSKTAGLANMGGNVEQTISTPAVAGNNPSVQPTGQKYPLTLPPSTTTVNQAGQKMYLGTGGNGQPVAAGMRPEDEAAIPGLSAERETARNQLASAPIAHATNRGILDELNNVAATGQTGGIISKALSVAGATPMGNTDAERAASAYDLIGKYTERNALEAAKAMGPGTNAGLEAAIRANGSASYNPTALKTITKFNDALTSGVEAYQPGLEKAITNSPNGILAKRQFDQAWAQNFDPRVFQLKNAQASGNQNDVNEVLNSIGGKNSPTARLLAQKWQNIQKLVTTGAL